MVKAKGKALPNQAPGRRAVAWPLAAIVEWQRSRLRAAGADPSLVPDGEPLRMIRFKEVMRLTTLSRAAIYREMAAGSFPRPIRLCSSWQKEGAR